MFVKLKDKNKLVKERENKYRIFSNEKDSNLNLYLKTNKDRLNNKDFTLISNDCWGAYIYTYLNIPYTSPFIWMYLSSSDFIKLAKNFKEYMDCELVFIETDMPHPVGMIGDIKLYFNHYKTEKEAKEKFLERKERINFDNLFFRVASENTNDVEEFKKIPYKNKVMFLNKDVAGDNFEQENVILMKKEGEYESFGQYAQLQSYKYFDIIEWLNTGKIVR